MLIARENWRFFRIFFITILFQLRRLILGSVSWIAENEALRFTLRTAF